MQLSNPSRISALSPIINALNHPNLIYLKASGLYEIGKILFEVLGVDAKPNIYHDLIQNANSIESPLKIILHHGSVDDANTSLGYKIINEHVSVSLFNKCNASMVMLGDIHKKQNLQKFKEEFTEIDESELDLYLKNGWKII